MQTSVVIPTADRPAQLERCLGALAASEPAGSPFEVIVVDAGSAAIPTRAIEPFGDRLDLTMVRCPGQWPAAARNAGAERAHGRMLAFTDDDVIPDPAWIRALWERLQADPDALIGGRTVNGLPHNPYSDASQRIVDLAYAFHNAGQGGPRFFASNNMALPADRFREIGGFDTSFRTSEDRELCRRWIARGWPMAEEAGAVVAHTNDLTLTSFWRQQLGYGRGAFAYHRSISEGMSGGLDPSFYSRYALPALFDALRQGRLRLVLLLGLWQVANASGFAFEAVRRRRD